MAKNGMRTDKYGLTKFDKTPHLGDEVCFVSEDGFQGFLTIGFYLGGGVDVVGGVTRNFARVLVTTDETGKYKVNNEYRLFTNKMYKIVPNKTFMGHFVCYEKDDNIDYPYYSPIEDENCYGIELVDVVIPKVKDNDTTLHIVNNRFECEVGVELPDGRVIVQRDKLLGVFMRYDVPFNIKKRVCYNFDVREDIEEIVKHVDDFTTLNMMLANGLGKEITCYSECDICVSELGLDEENPDFDKIIKAFAEQGFLVDKKALEHNYNAWQGDMKSGYRDEKHDVHVFTPCGCNPLSFRVTTLSYRCEYWQQTYEC